MPDCEPVQSARLDDVLDMPGHLLRRCHQIAVSIFIDECRDFELTPLQYVIMSSLEHHGPMDQVRLGGQVALDRTTVSHVLQNLQTRGLVIRKPGHHDKRSKLAELTSAGYQRLQRVHTKVDHAQQRILGPLSREEARTLIRLLSKVAWANNQLSRAPQSNSN